MVQCLIDNKVCPNGNKKCKICKLDNCKEVLNIIEEKQKYEDNYKLKQIKDELPEQCKNCSFLEITNLREGKVFCPYKIKDRCLIKE